MAPNSILLRGFRLILGYVRAHPRPFAIAVLGTTMYAAASVASAIVLGRATDNVLVPAFEEGRDPNAWWAAAAMVAVAVIRSAGVVARRFFAGLTAARTLADLQRGVVRRFVAMPLDRLRSRPRGEMLAHLDTDASAATEAIHPLPFSVGAIAMLVFGIGSLVVVDRPLMLVTASLLPLIALTSWINARLVHEPTAEERRRNAALSATADEVLDGLLIVKTLGREEAETARFAADVDAHRRARIQVGVLRSVFHRLLTIVPDLGVVTILAVGVSRIDDGAITPGDLVQAVAVFGVLSFPLTVIGFFLTDLPVSVVGHERVDRLLHEPDDHLLAPHGQAVLPAGPLPVRLHDIVVNGRLRVDELGVTAGETVAIVGPTGGGKSTLIEVVCRLRPTDRGTVEIGGLPLADIAHQSLRRRVTLATQEASLFSGTLLENTAFSRDVPTVDLDRSLELAGAGELRTVLVNGYDTVVGERGVMLSGGQRQRVALARALVGGPGLVVLDDATSAVDPAIEEGILAHLADLGCTVLMVTHRVAAMAAADRVALVTDGRLAAIGPHREMNADERYRALVEAYLSAEVLG